MSTEVEREGGVSTLMAGLGIWLALGAGLLILVAGLLVTVEHTYPRNIHTSLEQELQESIYGDLMGLISESVTVSEPGTRLSLKNKQAGTGEIINISYSIQNKEVIRETSNAESRSLGTALQLTFSESNGMILIRWRDEERNRELRFAYDRWSGL